MLEEEEEEEEEDDDDNADADDEDDCLLNVWMFLCFPRMPRGFLRSGGICTHK